MKDDIWYMIKYKIERYLTGHFPPYYSIKQLMAILAYVIFKQKRRKGKIMFCIFPTFNGI